MARPATPPATPPSTPAAPAAPAPAATTAPAGGAVAGRPLRPTSSILLKVVAALVGAVVAFSAVAEFVNAGLAGSVLDRQVRELTEGHLSTVAEAYEARERQLQVTLRNLSQLLTVEGWTAHDRRLQLVAELGRVAGNLEIEVLKLVDLEGADLSPPVNIGPGLASRSYVPEHPSAPPNSRIVPTGAGRYAQVLAVPLPQGGGPYLLVGGYAFGDAFAFELRQQVGGAASITLVAGGQVVGSTLADPQSEPPGMREGRLPEAPEEVGVGGVSNVVAYVPFSRAPDGTFEAAVGVVLPDLLGEVDRALVQTRLASIVVLTLVAVGLGWLLFRTLVAPMVGLARTAGRVAAGDTEANFGLRRPDEIGVLAESLERMRQELQARLELIAQQAADLQESSQRIVAAEDEERHRLARDLHDGIQQQLVVLRIQLGMLEDGAFAQGGAVAQQLGEQLDRAIEQLREVTQDLYPSILIDRGLAAALRTYVGRLPVSARLRCDPDELPRLTPEIESAAYFLVCEALTNALKHAAASTIEVSLRLRAGWLAVRVADDGRGFPAGDGRRGGGLQHMKDRVVAFGGVLDIDTSPGSGTSVTATFPDRRLAEPSLWRSEVGLGS